MQNFKDLIMKNILFILILIAGLTLSCEDFLDFEPKTELTPQAALNSEEDVVLALNGVYSSLQKDGYFGTQFSVIGDASSDNGVIPNDREAAGAGISRMPHAYTLELTAVNTAEEFWKDGYVTIASVNNILERLDEVTFDEAFENRVRAECLTIRAMTHFDLAKVFAQDYNYTSDQSHLAVPYQFKSVPGTEPGRNTMAEIYEFAFTDINEAISLFENGDGTELSNYRKGADMRFVSYYAAVGIKARLYFYMGNYADALTNSDIIVNGPYSLTSYTTVEYTPGGFDYPVTFINEWYPSGVIEVVVDESIFQLETDEDDGDFANRSFIDLYLANDGNAAHGPSQGLLDLYEPGDLRQHWFVDEHSTPAPDRHIYKYPGSVGINADAHAIVVMRLPEFLLMSAECEARIGSEDRARTLVNLVTDRSNASAITSSGNDLVEDIITERRKELAWEGHRTFDLKRLQRGFIRTDCRLTNVCSVDYPSDLYAWPIPQDELNANPVIRGQQNPGY